MDALAAPAYREAVNHAWLISSSILGEVGRAIVLYGLVAVLGAILAGPSRVAVATRSRLAPILNERADITWGGAAFGFLLLVLWGGTHALRTWWGSCSSAGCSHWESSRSAGRPCASTRNRDRSPPAMRRRRSVHEPQAALRPKPEADPAQTQAAELARLAALHDSGALTDDEFARAEARRPCHESRRRPRRGDRRRVPGRRLRERQVLGLEPDHRLGERRLQRGHDLPPVGDGRSKLAEEQCLPGGFQGRDESGAEGHRHLRRQDQEPRQARANAGDQAKTTLDTLSGQLQTGLDTVKNADDEGLVQSLSTVTTALATAQTQIKTAFDQLKGLDAQGELSDAFKQASACDSLRSG